MFPPRPRISPSGASLISTPGIGRPTEPNLKLSSRLLVSTGQVSVRPYPSRMRMPAAWKNSAISRDSGAPPETAKRSLPPSAACILENSSFSAILYLTASAAGTGRPALPAPRRRVEDLPLDRGAALGRGPRSRVDLLEDAGHAADEVRLGLGQGLPELVDVLGAGRAKAAVHPHEGPQ